MYLTIGVCSTRTFQMWLNTDNTVRLFWEQTRRLSKQVPFSHKPMSHHARATDLKSVK